MTINDVITVLRSHERQGAERDVPEGSRIVVLSDTLAKQMADTLEREGTQQGAPKTCDYPVDEVTAAYIRGYAEGSAE